MRLFHVTIPVEVHMRLRKARFAGSWYTQDPVVLRSEIDEFLELVQQDAWHPISEQPKPKARKHPASVRAGMLPHAGLYFSGRGISHFFFSLGAETERVIIIAPSHYVPLMTDTLFYSTHDWYDTPLGRISASEIVPDASSQFFREHNHAVEMEHAAEMFLPFIARTREVSLLPLSAGILLVSEISGERMLKAVTEELLQLLGEEELTSGRTVLIASSDFTHYGPRFSYTPFGTEDISSIEKEVEQHDRAIAELFSTYQFEKLIDAKSSRDMTICGFAPGLIVSSLMERIGARGEICDCYNSNHLTGPDIGFVSYCTILWR